MNRITKTNRMLCERRNRDNVLIEINYAVEIIFLEFDKLIGRKLESLRIHGSLYGPEKNTKIQMK